MSDTGDSEAIHRAIECVEHIGDEIVSDDTIESDSGGNLKILLCRHGNTPYEIMELNSKGLQINYRYNLTTQIAKFLRDGEIENHEHVPAEQDFDFKSVDEATRELAQDDISEATDASDTDIAFSQGFDNVPEEIKVAKDILESIEKEVLNEFSLNLFQELSNPEVATSIIEPDEYFMGFTVSRKIFPNDSGFSLTEFNHSVQAVVSTGTFGHNWTAQLLETELGIGENM